MNTSPSIKVQIIDNDIESCRRLESFIRTNPKVIVDHISTSSILGLEYLIKNPPTILFLAMRMTEMNGIELIKKVKKIKPCVNVVAVSGHKEYAIEAIHESIFDYILKPFDKEDIEGVFKKYVLNENSTKKEDILKKRNKFIFRTNNGADIVNLNEIVYVEADKNYSYFFLENNTRKISCINLGRLEMLLPKTEFKRISRKHIINLNKLDSIDSKKKLYKLKTRDDFATIKYTISINEILDYFYKDN